MDRSGLVDRVPGRSRTTSTLFGRDEERAELEALLARARQGLSGCIVVTGEAGIGKSRLLQHAVDVAGGFHISRVAGVESEEQLGFAGLHRLLLPYLDKLRMLPPPQRAALSAALGLQSATAEPFLVGLATLTLLAEVSNSAPHLCVIDDAQWIDPESLSTLGFVARRLQAEGLAMMFAARESAELRGLEALPRRDLVELPHEPARALFESLVPGRLLESTARTVLEAAAGNPLALTEMSVQLSPEQLAGGSPLPDHLPLGQALAEHYAQRLGQLPPDTRDLLTLMDIATADNAIGAAEFWGAAARLSLTPDTLEHAVRVGFVLPGQELTFRHPLIRSAVHAGSSTTTRRRSHAALAAVTDARVEPDSHTWHRAAAAEEPDEEIASGLEMSADRAAARGAHSRQAILLQRAADLSPARTAQLTRRLAAARAGLMAGDLPTAIGLLESVPADTPDPVLRAHTALARAALDLRLGHTAHVASTLLLSVQALGPGHDDLRRELCLVAVAATLGSSGATAGTSLAQVGRALSATPRAEPATPRELFLRGFGARRAGHFGEAVTLFREAFETLRSSPATEASTPVGVLAMLAGWETWEESAAGEAAARMERFDREHGLLVPLRYTLLGLSHLETLNGRLKEAEALLFEANDNAAGIPIGGEQEWSMIHLRAWDGDADQVRSMAHEILTTWAADVPAMGDMADNAMLVLETGLGRHGEALPHARRLLAADPMGLNGLVLSLIVEVGSRAGDLDVARTALSRLEERTTLSGTSWALGARAFGRALLADSKLAQPLYEEAIDHLSRSTIATELARVHLVFGEWLRRRRRPHDARVELRQAHDFFSRIGASRFAERAALEIRATGGRVSTHPRSPGMELTAQQARIANLAAAGETNSEIATQLFLSASTVDYHLGKVFRRVGVTSRRQLAHGLAVFSATSRVEGGGSSNDFQADA